MMDEAQGSESRAAAAEVSSTSSIYPFENSGSQSRPYAAEHGNPPAPQPAKLWKYRVVKRLFDLLLVLIALPVLLPAMLIVAAAVRFTSPGPVFFSHRRISFGGAFFSMWKFRTMSVDSAERLEHYLSRHPKARAEWNLTHKLKHDPRVTPVGNFLRRFSLDELPQVWNVIAGRMSLVGPRPIVAAEVEKYGRCFDYYCRVKPGVTGLWQVSGRSKLTYPERVKLDRTYVEQWSLLGDVKVLIRTAKSVVNQDGAY
jgi:lipopolysaccharide/colanic/teichoic acid biosynthesis glycosyltransferase